MSRAKFPQRHTRMFVATSLLVIPLCACASESKPARVGMLELPLVAPAPQPNQRYALSGTFVLDDSEDTSVSVDEGDRSTSVTLTPRAGNYALELCSDASSSSSCAGQASWSVHLLTCSSTGAGDAGAPGEDCFDDPMATVTASVVTGAELVTDNPQSVRVRNRQTTRAIFEILVPGSRPVRFGRGALDIVVAVQDGYPEGHSCATAQECASAVCEDPSGGDELTCQASSCTDGVLNGDEIDVDCGAHCTPCSSSATFTLGASGLETSTATDVADVDGDGDLDVVAVSGLSEQPMRVYLNDGSGALTLDGEYTVGSPRDVALGDWDGDGDVDAFIACGGGVAVPDKLWLNDGSGTFSDSGERIGMANSRAVELADLDSDGHLDAVIGTVAAIGTVTDTPMLIVRNDGDGGIASVSATTSLHSVFEAAALDLGDLDGDGDIDAIVANGTTVGGQPLLNDGQGNLSTIDSRFDGLLTAAVQLGDVDGDSDLDAMFSYYHVNGSPVPVRVWLNDGTAAFADSGQRLAFDPLARLALGDLDGDGDLDVFGAQFNPNTRVVWLNEAGLFTESAQLSAGTPSAPFGVTLGDLDSDGDLDAIVAGGFIETWFNQ